MDISMFCASIVYAAVGLTVFSCGLIIASVPSQLLAKRTRHSNPGDSNWVSYVLITLLALWGALTIVGCIWLFFTFNKGNLDTLLKFATLISVVQGFVYGTVGVVLGWLGLRK